jgi:hypothetical protein
MTNVTINENNVVVVEVKSTGPQGPAGPSGAGYTHTQSAVSSTWTINHNLGYRPSVEILDTGNQEIEGSVSHPTVNQTVVTLTPATAGTARLN